jgi:hypothetical protein
MGTIHAAAVRQHRARWFVWAGGNGAPLEKIPHTASMRGSWPGWDASCSCGGWESRTGGATRASVQRDLDDHRLDAQLAEERLATGLRVTVTGGERAGQSGTATDPDGSGLYTLIVWDGTTTETCYRRDNLTSNA